MENEIQNGLTILENNKPTIAKLVQYNLPIGTPIEHAELLAMKEISNFEMILSLKPELAACDPTSILLAVKQCINDNLTLSPSAGLVYLYPGKVRVGTNSANQPVYKDILVYEPTSEGRLSIARQSGAILDHKRPTFTYDANGRVDTVTFEFLVPSYGAPRWEKIVFDKNNFAKWQQKSAAKFNGNANANYTSWNGGIDPEFAGSKAIKHALKKRGTNAMEVQRPVMQQMEVNQYKSEHQHTETATFQVIENAEQVTETHNAVVMEQPKKEIKINADNL